MANALPILLLGGAAAFFLTKKKPTKAVTNGNGKTNGNGAIGGPTGGKAPAPGEPGVGDTIAASTTPQGGVMWKVVRSPTAYQARWSSTKEPTVWHDAGEFETAAAAQQHIIDLIGLGQIP